MSCRSHIKRGAAINGSSFFVLHKHFFHQLCPVADIHLFKNRFQMLFYCDFAQIQAGSDRMANSTISNPQLSWAALKKGNGVGEHNKNWVGWWGLWGK